MRRRHFILAVLAALETTNLTESLVARPQENPMSVTSIQDVIDLIIRATPGRRLDETVDTVKAGDPAQRIRGVAATFLATYEVIRKAAEKDLNLIISHEPVYYNHLDEVGWLKGSSVYEAKKALLEEHRIVVWRFHDYWHMHEPDPMRKGLVEELEWDGDESVWEGATCRIPPIKLENLAAQVKRRLSISKLRVVGDLGLECRRIGILPGAAGGRAQIEFLIENEVDALLCGEVNEWETSEYVRDARAMGQKLALVVLGHAVSEEFGMKELVEWLSPRIPHVRVEHIAAGEAFTFV